MLHSNIRVVDKAFWTTIERLFKHEHDCKTHAVDFKQPKNLHKTTENAFQPTDIPHKAKNNN